jgi:uncharacterized membrane protein (DUF485 family)
MVGMIQILTYLFCVYLVFKGVEIFQIAWMSSSPQKENGMIAGAVMIAVSIIAAAAFYYLINEQAERVSGALQNIK